MKIIVTQCESYKVCYRTERLISASIEGGVPVCAAVPQFSFTPYRTANMYAKSSPVAEIFCSQICVRVTLFRTDCTNLRYMHTLKGSDLTWSY